IAADGDVQKNKELALELRRAVDAAGDVALEVLDSVDKPGYRCRRPRYGVDVEPIGERHRRIESPTERGVLVVRVGPVHGCKVNEGVLALHLHDVDLTAGGPPNRADIGAEIPECRPDPFTLWRFDARFYPRVDAERMMSAGIHASRGVRTSAEVL